ncbi:aspartate aminotransferase [Pseudoalteromonas tunicata D2]|uniref:Aspartate aminotransferase n=1 Tax=Pseudoalteromonas tunicata D2 TaxID=87626 RepID=A4C857_9GAMM|nr:aspartate aminotransferase [Pseudoalteromonas tunicata D2]
MLLSKEDFDAIATGNEEWLSFSKKDKVKQG